MNRTYIYTRHKLTRYTRDLIWHLGGDQKVFSEYDFGFPGQYYYISDFEKALRDRRLSGTTRFDDADVTDIVARCRLLRSLHLDEALGFIVAADRCVDRFINDRNPDLIVAPRIDTFFLDVLERRLRQYGRPYVGVWRSAFARDNFFLTNRGETSPISTVEDSAIQPFIRKIADTSFRATSLTERSYGNLGLFYHHAKRLSRDVVLEIIRNVSPHRHGYRELATGFHVHDYSVPLTGWVPKFSDDRIVRRKLQDERERNIFVALQVNPESTIDYYSPDIRFIEVEQVLLKLVGALTESGFNVFIKDHPNMFGRRNFVLINKLAGQDNVFNVRYEVSANEILLGCRYVFTWSGTVAVQAYFNGIHPIAVCSPYQLPLPGFGILRDFGDIGDVGSLMKSLATQTITPDMQRELARHILTTHCHGQVFTHDRVEPDARAFARALLDNRFYVEVLRRSLAAK